MRNIFKNLIISIFAAYSVVIAQNHLNESTTDTCKLKNEFKNSEILPLNAFFNYAYDAFSFNDTTKNTFFCITESCNGSISIYENGKRIKHKKHSLMSYPVAVHRYKKTDTLFIADARKNTVFIYNLRKDDINPLPGIENSQMDGPIDLTYWKDILYIVDSGNNRILRYNASLRELANPIINKELNTPIGIELNKNTGDLYILNWGNHNILKLNVDSTSNSFECWCNIHEKLKNNGLLNNDSTIVFPLSLKIENETNEDLFYLLYEVKYLKRNSEKFIVKIFSDGSISKDKNDKKKLSENAFHLIKSLTWKDVFYVLERDKRGKLIKLYYTNNVTQRTGY